MKRIHISSIPDNVLLNLSTFQLERIINTVSCRKDSIILQESLDKKVRAVCLRAAADIYRLLDLIDIKNCIPTVNVKTDDCKSISEIVIKGMSSGSTHFEFDIYTTKGYNGEDLKIYTPFSAVDMSEPSSAKYLSELAILTEKIHSIDWKDIIYSYKDKFPELSNDDSTMYVSVENSGSYTKERLNRIFKIVENKENEKLDIEKTIATLESCDFGNTLVLDNCHDYIYLILDIVNKGNSFLVKRLGYRKYKTDSHGTNDLSLFENVKDSRVRKDLFAKRLYQKRSRLFDKITNDGKIEAVLLKYL